jgi:hypothetical protein
MKPLETKILKECEAIASTVLTNYGEAKLISPTEIWTADDREKLARGYFEIARHELAGLALGEEDPTIVLRAIRYLKRCYAIPPLREDTAWFKHGLSVLVELACPDASVGPKGEPFFDDIQRGIRNARRA